MKLTAADIVIKGEGMQAKELILNKFGSIRGFIQDQNINTTEKAVTTYLHQWKITSHNFKFRLVYAFDADSYENLILDEERQLVRYLDMIDKDILSYNKESDKAVLDKIYELHKNCHLSMLDGRIHKIFGDYYYNINQMEQAIKCIRQAIRVEENATRLMACYSKLGLVYYIVDEYIESRIQHDKAEKYRIDYNIVDSEIVSLHFYRYGMLCNESEIYIAARSMFNKAIFATNDKSITGSCLLEIGLSYKLECRYDEALEAYFQAIDIFKELDDKRRVGILYNNIANLYINKKQFEIAMNYFELLKGYWDALPDREKITFTHTYYQIQTEMGVNIDMSYFMDIIDNIENLCPQKKYIILVFEILVNYGKMNDVNILYKIKTIVNNLKKKSIFGVFQKELMAIYGDISAFMDEGGYIIEEIN